MWKKTNCADGNTLYGYYLYDKMIAYVKNDNSSKESIWRIEIYYGDCKTMGDTHYESDFDVAKLKALCLAKDIGWNVKTVTLKRI